MDQKVRFESLKDEELRRTNLEIGVMTKHEANLEVSYAAIDGISRKKAKKLREKTILLKTLLRESQPSSVPKITQIITELAFSVRVNDWAEILEAAGWVIPPIYTISGAFILDLQEGNKLLVNNLLSNKISLNSHSSLGIVLLLSLLYQESSLNKSLLTALTLLIMAFATEWKNLLQKL
jgi:hypothetical protein